jgi:cytochrome c-type biogenesis protein CcmH/NrfF
MQNSKLSVLLSLLCPLLLHFGYAFAQTEGSLSEEVWQRRATDMYQQVLSPFCPGRSLNDCPSSKAQELKTDMLVKLQSGVAEQEVLEGVFAKFGDQYRAIPKGEGFGRLVWLVPGLFVFIGLAFAYYVSTRRAVSPSPVSGIAATARAISTEEEAELSRELENLN